jgi:asparagine synthase (glutamine-hydrolysing)
MHARFALTFGRGTRRHQLLERARNLGFSNIIDRGELLFVSDKRTPCQACAGALLVGQLFSAEGDRMTDLSVLAAEHFEPAILATSAHLWGNFALFLSSPARLGVYRDPSASIPVYRCGDGLDCIFVSDAELASRFGFLDQASTSLIFATHWLQFPFLRSARTGLAGVTEILPGTWLRFDGGWMEMRPWRPANFLAREDALMDASEAARRLREVALNVIPRQVGADSIVLQLSGGLDSSIVAYSLAKAGRKFSCVNFATASPDGDERQFAREAASTFGVALRELIEARGAKLAPPGRPSFRPGTNPLLLPFEEAVSCAAEELGAQLLVDGAGGDNLFCHLTSAAPVLDALIRAGPREAVRTIGAIALRANASWWDVVRAAERRTRRRNAWKDNLTFLNEGALLNKPDPHPWLAGLAQVPPGKREHVEALVHIQHFLDRRGSELPLLHPLLAQPLLELCLRIPSWLWMRGGRDRAVARDAFKDHVPAPILNRRSKGSLLGLFYRSFGLLQREMVDLLLTGELNANGIIDAQALQAAIRAGRVVRDDLQLRISEMVALELWLQSWKSRPHRSSIRF